MKAEQRKESSVAALGERASRLWHDMGARPSTGSIVFWLVVILVVALIAAWFLWSRWSLQSGAAEWVQVLEANSLDDLRNIAKEHPGTTPAEMAQFDEARALLRQGLDKYAARDEKERTEAKDKIQQAGDLYEKLAGQARSYPLLTQEAYMGAAKAKESLGDLDGALPLYQKLAGLQPKTALVEQASQRAQDLQDPAKKEQIKKFYDALTGLPPAKPAENKP